MHASVNINSKTLPLTDFRLDRIEGQRTALSSNSRHVIMLHTSSTLSLNTNYAIRLLESMTPVSCFEVITMCSSLGDGVDQYTLVGPLDITKNL